MSKRHMISKQHLTDNKKVSNLYRIPLLLQVIFSSTIMYNNYMTITQRRRMVQEEREHAERLQVQTLPSSPQCYFLVVAA